MVRESYREDGKSKKRTVANISQLPKPIQESVKQQLKGKTYIFVSEAFEILESRQHGHVEAVMTAMKRLKLPQLIAPKRCRERDLVVGDCSSNYRSRKQIGDHTDVENNLSSTDAGD